jgi:hypothetical protein
MDMLKKVIYISILLVFLFSCKSTPDFIFIEDNPSKYDAYQKTILFINGHYIEKYENTISSDSFNVIFDFPEMNAFSSGSWPRMKGIKYFSDFCYDYSITDISFFSIVDQDLIQKLSYGFGYDFKDLDIIVRLENNTHKTCYLLYIHKDNEMYLYGFFVDFDLVVNSMKNALRPTAF